MATLSKQRHDRPQCQIHADLIIVSFSYSISYQPVLAHSIGHARMVHVMIYRTTTDHTCYH
jgi:hypothetical protein